MGAGCPLLLSLLMPCSAIAKSAYKLIWMTSKTNPIRNSFLTTDPFSITKPLRMNLLMQAINKCATLGSLVTTMNVRGDDPLPLNSPKLNSEALKIIAMNQGTSNPPGSPKKTANSTPRVKGHAKRPSTSGLPMASEDKDADLASSAERRLDVPPLLRFHST